MNGTANETRSNTDLSALRVLAARAARAGGRIARERHAGTLDARLKPDRSEVTDADEAAQAAVIAVIHEARPDDAVIAEEQLALEPALPPPSNSSPCWVIDPIDGTRNYVRRMGDYCTSVGVLLEGVPVAGAIYDPQRDVLYSACAGGTLLRNDQTLPAADGDAPPNRSLVVGIPSTAAGPVRDYVLDWFDRCITRNFGSTAIHLALVATGQLDGAIADNPKLWDLAAGWVLITAVGGQVTGPDGAALFPIDVGAYRCEEMPLVATHRRAGQRLRHL